MTTMSGKRCVVTGGNVGIGKETVRGLARAGAEVILACRDTAKGEAARSEVVASVPGAKVEVVRLDLADTGSIKAFATEVREMAPQLDVLVNNAGVWTRTRNTTRDGFESTFGVNHLGHFLLTHELRGLLEKSPAGRVITVSSALHYRGKMAWDDLMAERSYDGPRAYNQSKLANVLFTAALARHLTGTHITANCLHPGVVATELAREYPKMVMKIVNLFMLTPAQGAETSLFLATSPTVATVTGKYFEKSREKKPAALALDLTAQDRLWSLSEKLLGLPSS
jgi:NAD(P)-dependent dehydrogenase (short-subunit alcohol dehydrogenase family)